MSFRKRAAQSRASPILQNAQTFVNPRLPPGVRPSANSSSAITSWGFRPIDTALGGGLPLGTLTIVLEDHPTAYHIPLCSYVSAQGIKAGHAVAVVSFDAPAEELLRRLPACVSNHSHVIGDVPSRQRQRETADMKIAWRYQKNNDSTMPFATGVAARPLAFDFDFSQSETIPKSAPVSSLGRGVSKSLDDVLGQLRSHLEKSAEQKLLSRIVIHGLSTMHIGKGVPPSEALSSFLVQVRAFTRVYGAIAVVSCAPDVPYRIATVCSDATLKIDSFGGRGAGVAGLGKEWLGVMIIKKAYRDGRGPSLRGTGDVWVFKRGRRKYAMERATAAPDDEIGTDHHKVDLQSKDKSSTLPKHNTPANPGLCSSRPGNSGIEF